MNSSNKSHRFLELVPNPDSSLPTEPFTRADRTSCTAPQLMPIQHDELSGKQRRELRRLAYVYKEPGPGRDSAHAHVNPMGAAYMVVIEIPLATAASAEGDNDEYRSHEIPSG